MRTATGSVRADSVRTLWESEKKLLHVVIPHTDISYVDYWLSEAVSLIETENYADAQSKIEVLLVLCRQIPQTYRITFENWNGKDSLWQASFEEVMVAGPMLLLNGKNFFPELNNSGGRHPRSCIGIRKDGSVILLVIDGRRKKAAGMSFSELAKVCLWLKMESALNLDGGGSSSLWVKNKKTVNRPSDGIAFIHRDRKVCNMISVESKDKNE